MDKKDEPNGLAIESNSPVADVPFYRSSRVMLAFISAWGYVFFYVLRIDLSLAIVCMVKDPTSQRLVAVNNVTNQTSSWSYRWNENTTTSSSLLTHSANTTQERLYDDSSGVCGAADDDSLQTQYTGELEWGKELRGYVLSSFFYGYMVTQVPGGWLASRYGGKHVFGTGILITLIATLLVPVAARAHVYLLIALRVIMGLACGVGFPATHQLFGRWLPPLERSKFMAFSYAGTFIGTIIALFFSGFLCDSGVDNGWPLIFYVYGGVTFIWWVLWNIFVYNSPEDHPRIDPIERNYIMKTIGSAAYQHDDKIPWAAIAKSRAVWAIIVSHACNNWANYTILICIPMYMTEVLQFSVKQNGALSALPHIISYLGAVASGQLADFLRSRKILTTTVTRKIFQCISSGIPAILIVSMGFVDCQLRYAAVALLCLTLLFNSTCRAGFMVNHVDISPRHAGILFGISNTVATIPGMLAPTVVGIITPHGSREEWLNVFLICGGLYLISTVVYAFLADGKEQKWATSSSAVEPAEEKETSQI